MENRLPIHSIRQRFVMVAAALHDFCQERAERRHAVGNGQQWPGGGAGYNRKR